MKRSLSMDSFTPWITRAPLSLAVYSGVLQPENIIIHVTQNLMNFLSSTLAWFLLLNVYTVIKVLQIFAQKNVWRDL
jgi:hypothetical protein